MIILHGHSLLIIHPQYLSFLNINFSGLGSHGRRHFQTYKVSCNGQCKNIIVELTLDYGDAILNVGHEQPIINDNWDDGIEDCQSCDLCKFN